MKSRTVTLAGIKRETFDLCVIGGGATGAGCALDAGLRGLKTVLVDAGDFASGSSSASTKLVHGGVRYLQQAVSNLDFDQYRVDPAQPLQVDFFVPDTNLPPGAVSLEAKSR